MPIHDWTRVPHGIYHHFHHEWISEMSRTLNRGLLPEGYYALDEQTAAGFGPDVLTRQTAPNEPPAEPAPQGSAGPGTAVLVRPQATHTTQTDAEFYRRKKSSIAIRHVSDDRIVAMIEIVSPGNKASKRAFRAMLKKAWEMLENKVHLLFIDPFPPTRRHPRGLHAALWAAFPSEDKALPDGRFVPPPEKPLTLAAYESDLFVKAFVEFVAVGEPLPNMPLILEPGAAVMVPLEATYQAAFAAVPTRWRRVLEAPRGSSSA